MILKPDRVITGDGKTVLEQYAVQISEESGKITRVAPQAQLCKETAERKCAGIRAQPCCRG